MGWSRPGQQLRQAQEARIEPDIQLLNMLISAARGPPRLEPGSITSRADRTIWDLNYNNPSTHGV